MKKAEEIELGFSRPTLGFVREAEGVDFVIDSGVLSDANCDLAKKHL